MYVKYGNDINKVVLLSAFSMYKQNLMVLLSSLSSRDRIYEFRFKLIQTLNNISIYKAYIRDTKSLKYLSEPFLFSNANNTDPGAIPKHLPTLTKVKEIIITYIYVYLQVAQVRRQ